MSEPLRTLPRTLRELKHSGYRPQSVKAEMRRNLLAKLKRCEPLFPGILGYDETVLPQIQNAILSQHDMLFLGLRGQGKTRMLRMLTLLLDEFIPVVAGSEIHDDPMAPISKFARDLVAHRGDETPITWIGRDDRYNEKLATPDVTIADLIGEIDLVKHAEGRHLSSEDVLHFGLIPRSHRGIFCMNELPDLSPKIQVGLFNVLEERDVQIRGFPIRLNLDVCLVFSANPEDYTNRGRIVTPLKDRIGSVIRTHYPLTRELGMKITTENSWVDRADSLPVFVPRFLQEIVEETARLARTSPHVNQASGVSVRMSISNFENLISSAERRAIIAGETQVVARPEDLLQLAASSRGKLELTMADEPGEEDRLIGRLFDEALKNVFDGYELNPKQFRNVVEYFETGKTLDIAEGQSDSKLMEQFQAIRGFRSQIEQVTQTLEPELTRKELLPSLYVSVGQFLLDALHCHNRLNRTRKLGTASYGS
ncbi:MAG: magnesium chelatase [Planctomycetes bacterium]|nr:magnesium chelatase [Planctomycetota bacterium]